MKKITFLTTAFIFSFFANAQVLFSENFNSYPTGHLNTDYTGATAGQGGWVADRHASAIAVAIVTPESGKGNVITFTTTGNFSNEYVIIKQNTNVIDSLWNNRTAGNNVLKMEYEVYGSGHFNAYGNLYNNNFSLMYLRFASTTGYFIEVYHEGLATAVQKLKSYTSANFPHNIWLKVEMFIDFNTKKVYYYIPTLNIFKVDLMITSNLYYPDNISISGDWLKPGSVVKYDNIKLSALPTVPAYILSANEMVSATFNMYPNPATNVVNITNTQNILVEQITIYDMAGKQLNTQSFNNESEVQLNIENLASGNYLLHIQTNAGLAVKKLVKK